MNNSLGEEIIFESLSLNDIVGWMEKKQNVGCFKNIEEIVERHELYENRREKVQLSLL